MGKEHHVHHHLPKHVNFLVIVVAIVVALAGLKLLIPDMSINEPGQTVTGAVVGLGPIPSASPVPGFPAPPPPPPNLPVYG